MNDSAAIPAPPWNPPKPEQLPFLRLSLLEQLRNPLYQEEVARALASGLGTLHPLYGTPQEQAGALLYEERLRLNSAKMWSAGEEVVQLAVQAGQNLPTWKVRREDILGPCGLLVFDAPITQYVNTSNETVSIVAASWGPSDFLGDDQLWVTFWSVVNFDLLAHTVKHQLGCSMAQAREVARLHKMADLNWDNEVAMTFNDHTIRLADRTDPVDPAAEQHMLSQTTTSWVQTLRAAWLLIAKANSQKIVEVEERHVPRSVQKRQRRAGVADTSGVNVVRLHSTRRRRHSVSAGEDGNPEGGKLSVRFPVSGHIRWQPYPTRGTIEPKFIETYDKGPEGAPYRVGKKYTVYRLDEPPK